MWRISYGSIGVEVIETDIHESDVSLRATESVPLQREQYFPQKTSKVPTLVEIAGQP
jgi:hypothetical protein